MDIQNEQHSETVRKKSRMVRLGTAILGIFCVGIIIVVAILALLAFRPDNAIGKVVRRVFPFPVAIVDGAFISYGELDKDRESIRRFYESQSDDLAKKGFRVDFNTPEGQNRLILREKDILNKLVEDRIILSLAHEKNIYFSERDVTTRVEKEIRTEEGNQKNLEEELRRLYGWSLSEFQEKIVSPSLYRDALEASFEKSRDTKAARAAIEKASVELSKGTSFERVAEKFSEGDSKNNGGNLGWTDIETLIPELRDAAQTQAIGTIGSPIDSLLGFHILSVLDRKTESGKTMANLRQIFTRKPQFPEWLAEQKRQKTVLLLPRRYIWDTESGSVLFRDEGLRAFEKNALRQSEGDPSLVF